MIDIVFTKRNDRVKMFFSRCKELKDALNHICENCRPILNNDAYLTDAELAQRLRVSRRTLHDYQNSGMLPYYEIGGKYLYSEKDVDNLLMSNYRNVICNP